MAPGRSSDFQRTSGTSGESKAIFALVIYLSSLQFLFIALHKFAPHSKPSSPSLTPKHTTKYSDGTRSFFDGVQAKNKATYDAWQKTYAEWKAANPLLATHLEDGISKTTPSPAEMFAKIPPMDTGAEATRVSGYKVIQKIAEMVPTYISGSADLHGSTRNYIDGGENFGAGFDKSYAGKVSFFLYFFLALLPRSQAYNVCARDSQMYPSNYLTDSPLTRPSPLLCTPYSSFP